jgi:hypothetical protein
MLQSTVLCSFQKEKLYSFNIELMLEKSFLANRGCDQHMLSTGIPVKLQPAYGHDMVLVPARISLHSQSCETGQYNSWDKTAIKPRVSMLPVKYPCYLAIRNSRHQSLFKALKSIQA